MKTIIAAIILLLLNASSFAQFIAAEGFFDTDPGVGNGLPLSFTQDGSVADFSSNLPTGITQGIHTLYVRTRAASNLWSVARGRVVLVDQSPFLPPQIIEIDQCEYFIDSDPGVGNGINVPITLNASEASIAQSILTSLSPGFYRLALRFRSTANVWSVSRIRTFYVRMENDNQVADEIVEAEYFIGTTDPGVGNANPLPLESIGDPVSFATSATTALAPGIYPLSVRFKSSAGLWSVARSRYFNVIDGEANQLAEEIIAAEYFIDADPGVGEGIQVNLASPDDAVDIAAQAMISAGLGTHILYLRTKSDRQLWSVPRGRAFIVTNDPLYPLNEIVYAEYYIDTDPGEGNAVAMAIVEGSIVPLDGTIPTVGINPGEHTLFIRVLSNLGIWSEIASQTFIITSDEPFFDITALNTLCADSDDGQITVELFGGNSTYTYEWDGVVGTETLTEASGGDHHLIVTDADDNVVLDTIITVIAPEPLAFEVVATSTSCFGSEDGSALVTTSGGTGDVDINWNGADPSQLSGGPHDFTLTDENGCVLSGSAEIPEPVVLNATSSVEPTSTSTSCDGSISVEVSGGTAPYSYAWTPTGPDSDELTDLCTGSYSVVITDANSCTYELSGVLITVNVSTLNYDGIEIFTSPNPGNGLFSVSMTSEASATYSWQVLDGQGRLITESTAQSVVSGQSNFVLDLTTATNGVYFLQFKINNEPVTVQLIVQR